MSSGIRRGTCCRSRCEQSIVCPVQEQTRGHFWSALLPPPLPTPKLVVPPKLAPWMKMPTPLALLYGSASPLAANRTVANRTIAHWRISGGFLIIIDIFLCSYVVCRDCIDGFAAATKFTLRFTFVIPVVPRRVCYLTRDAPKPPTNFKPNALFHNVSVLCCFRCFLNAFIFRFTFLVWCFSVNASGNVHFAWAVAIAALQQSTCIDSENICKQFRNRCAPGRGRSKREL